MTKKNENRKEIMRERNNTRMIRVANINRCKIIAFRMMRRERERERKCYPSASLSVTFRSRSSCSLYRWRSAYRISGSKSELNSNWRILVARVSISMALTCCSNRWSISVLSIAEPFRCFRISSRLIGTFASSVDSCWGAIMGWTIFESLKAFNFSSRFASMATFSGRVFLPAKLEIRSISIPDISSRGFRILFSTTRKLWPHSTNSHCFRLSIVGRGVATYFPEEVGLICSFVEWRSPIWHCLLLSVVDVTFPASNPFRPICNRIESLLGCIRVNSDLSWFSIFSIEIIIARRICRDQILSRKRKKCSDFDCFPHNRSNLD